MILTSCSNATRQPTATDLDSFLGLNGIAASRLERRYEEGIAQCMKSEGFTYTPKVRSLSPVDQRDRGTLDPEKFVQTYGYGLSTLLPPSAQASTDPNQNYVNTLSPAARHSYFIALNQTSENSADHESPSAPPAESCEGRTLTAMVGDLAQIEELSKKYEEIDLRANQTAVVVRARQAWSRCMTSSGYQFANPEDAPTSIDVQLQKLDRNDQLGIRKLQRDELTLASIDWKCAQPLNAAKKTATESLRIAFIDDNKASLEKLRKTLNAAS
jgi:hypothetical protein